MPRWSFRRGFFVVFQACVPNHIGGHRAYSSKSVYNQLTYCPNKKGPALQQGLWYRRMWPGKPYFLACAIIHSRMISSDSGEKLGCCWPLTMGHLACSG